jgi:hypothetical protein
MFRAYLLTALLLSSCATDDSCGTVSCLNQGLCANGTCLCLDGFEGESCELVTRDRLVGTYNGQEVCTDVAPYTYPLFIAEGTEGAASILIGNFANRVIGVRGTIEGSGVRIPDQTIQVQSGNVQVEGAGILSDTSLFFYFTLQDASGMHECNLLIPLN